VYLQLKTFLTNTMSALPKISEKYCFIFGMD